MSLQQPDKKRNNIATQFEIEKKATKRNRVVDHFKIEKKIKNANKNILKVSFFYQRITKYY